jgi:HlyD family secretion protein
MGISNSDHIPFQGHSTQQKNVVDKKGKNVLHRTQRFMIRLTLLSLLLGGSGFLVYRWVVVPRQTSDRQTQTVQVQRRSLPITVSANGTVEPERSINISPVTSGRLKELLVKEADVVQQGQIIAYMDDSTLRGQLIQAQGQLASAQANLQLSKAGNRPEEILEAEAKLTEAQAGLREAESTFQQDTELYQAGAISKRELQTSQSSRDSAQAKVNQAQQGLAIQRAGSRQEEIARSQAEVDAAQGNVDYINSQLDNMIIRAPFSGVVIRKFADPGAFVAPTTSASAENSATSSSILSLGTKNQVTANVAETSIGRMRVGQAAIIKADAFPGKEFRGRVVEIAPQSTVQQNVTSFEVKVSLTDPEALLRSGMNVDAVFQVGTLSNAVMVPTSAIVRRENETGLYVQKSDQSVVFQPIETGTTVGGETEILSGLQGDEAILLSYPEGEKPNSGPSLFPSGKR